MEESVNETINEPLSNKIVCDSNDLARKYIDEVRKAYLSLDDEDKFWENFENAYCGATEDDISKWKNEYPEISDTLLDLLKIVDGSYYRTYGENEYSVYLLGSDLKRYPYYLLSVKQMLENVNIAYDNLGQYVDRKYDEDEVEMVQKDRLYVHFMIQLNSK